MTGPKNLFQKKAALPTDHGSWVFLLSPFLIGLFAGGELLPAHIYLLASLLAVFLLRQPAATLVKTFSGRAGKNLRSPALFWLALYGLVALASLILLLQLAFGYLFWLAIPGMAVFGWHLWLVSKRRERRQMGIDIIAAGSLAMAAPAAYWVSVGSPEISGWWLWWLTWLQSAASIVYAFLRLEQRVLKLPPTPAENWKMGWRSLLYSGFNLILAILAASLGWLPDLIWLPYLIQFSEVIWGTTHPALGVKPTHIGFRQLTVSTLFTLAFILVW